MEGTRRQHQEQLQSVGSQEQLLGEEGKQGQEGQWLQTVGSQELLEGGRLR